MSKPLRTPVPPREGVEGGAPLPGDFRVIFCPSPLQMNDFCDLLGTPDTIIFTQLLLRAVHLKIPFCTMLKSDQILLKILNCIANYIVAILNPIHCARASTKQGIAG